MTTLTGPRSDVDLFSDETLNDPYPVYRALRDLGPAVYLEQLDAWAVMRYADVRAVLKDWQTFTSRKGIGFNEVINSNMDGQLPSMDGEEHDRFRAILNDDIRLGSVREMTAELQRRADDMVTGLVERGCFDAIEDLARAYPSEVVGSMLGLSREASSKLFRWGDASFTAVGPLNDRTNAALPVIAELFAFMTSVTKADFVTDSIGYKLYEAGERGKYPMELCPNILWNFTGAGADTTISSIGNMIWFLGRHPQAWSSLQEDPTLIPSAINEVLRYEASIQVWGRETIQEVDIDGVQVPSGARIALGLASANRDERHYEDADTFDITRNPRDLVTFGYGIHLCIGAPLARAQLASVLEALLKRVNSFEVGEPVRHYNNTVRGLESLTVTVQAK